MDFNFSPKEAAEAEIGWWKAHHEKNYEEVTKRMTKLYELLYGLNAEMARNIVLLRIEAAKEHDLAEKEGVSKEESDRHWENALSLMTEHFTLLKKGLKVKG